MSSINFSDTTPAAPTGGVNLRWQQDGNGNISAYAAKSDITGGLVTSVFGRTGDVVAQSGDYNAGQVLYAVDQRVGYSNPMWLASLDYSKLTNVPANVGAVSSVFGRTGAVVAAAGDYTAAQVTNAVDTMQSYANPAWITSLDWSKITGAPTAAQIAAMQTPWLQNISAAGFTLSNVPAVTGNGNITVAAGGAGALSLQTSSLTRMTIAANGNVGIGTSSPSVPLHVTAGSSGFAAFVGTRILSETGYLESSNVSGGYTGLILSSGKAGSSYILDQGTGLGLYANGANPMIFATNGAERMRIAAAGNVGIGTTAPLNLFTVHCAPDKNIGLRLNTRASIGSFNDAGNASAPLGFDASVFDFSGGNVGIGTSAPACSLDAAGTIRATGQTAPTGGVGLELAWNAAGPWATILAYDRTAGAVKQLNISGNPLNLGSAMTIPAAGNVGIGNSSPAAQLHVQSAALQFMLSGGGATKAAGFVVNNSGGDPTQGGLMLQRYTPTGTFEANLLTVNLANAYVGLGGTTGPAYLLHLNADSAAKPSTSTWTIASDVRLKRNARPLAGGLAIIRALEVLEAEYNGEDSTPKGGRVVSFDAAKVRALVPHAVTSHKGRIARERTDVLDLNIHEILMHLVLAVQQLAAKGA
jgi:hypothetical protein